MYITIHVYNVKCEEKISSKIQSTTEATKRCDQQAKIVLAIFLNFPAFPAAADRQ